MGLRSVVNGVWTDGDLEVEWTARPNLMVPWVLWILASLRPPFGGLELSRTVNSVS